MSDTDRPLPFETHLGVDIEAEMKRKNASKSAADMFFKK